MNQREEEALAKLLASKPTIGDLQGLLVETLNRTVAGDNQPGKVASVCRVINQAIRRSTQQRKLR